MYVSSPSVCLRVCVWQVTLLSEPYFTKLNGLPNQTLQCGLHHLLSGSDDYLHFPELSQAAPNISRFHLDATIEAVDSLKSVGSSEEVQLMVGSISSAIQVGSDPHFPSPAWAYETNWKSISIRSTAKQSATNKINWTVMMCIHGTEWLMI